MFAEFASIISDYVDANTLETIFNNDTYSDTVTTAFLESFTDDAYTDLSGSELFSYAEAIATLFPSLGIDTSTSEGVAAFLEDYVWDGTDSIASTISDLASSYFNAEIGTDDADDIVLSDSSTGYVFGGDGNDNIEMNGVDDVVAHGGAGNDSLDAVGVDSFLFGGEGDDELNGRSGDDSMVGGAGDDEINAGSGDDVIFETTVDTSAGAAADMDTVRGGAGEDTLVYNASSDDFDFTYNSSGSWVTIEYVGDDETADYGTDVVNSAVEYIEFTDQMVEFSALGDFDIA